MFEPFRPLGTSGLVGLSGLCKLTKSTINAKTFWPNLIFFQNGLGQKRIGIEKTVYKLFNYYNNKITYNNSNKYFIPNKNNLVRNICEIYNLNHNLIKHVNIPYSTININIGGDHSMSIGSLGATLNTYGVDTKVIWIDAHADINTRASSLSGNVHGMPLGFLTGLDKSQDYGYISTKLKFDNLCYIGIRDLDREEIKTIKTQNIKTITSTEFNSNTTGVINKLSTWCQSNPVHLSIDVDSLDPSYMQFTGTKAPNGLELLKLIEFINQICTKINIVNTADIKIMGCVHFIRRIKMQRIDDDLVYEFKKKHNKFISELICFKCKHKCKKKTACCMNNIAHLDLKTNTCKKFEDKNDG